MLGAKAADAKGLVTVLVRPPAANPALSQLEEPGHLVLACGGSVLVPGPDPLDQRHRPIVVLTQLPQRDRLLPPSPTRTPLIECSSTSGSSPSTNASKPRSLNARMNSRTGS